MLDAGGPNDRITTADFAFRKSALTVRTVTFLALSVTVWSFDLSADLYLCQFEVTPSVGYVRLRALRRQKPNSTSTFSKELDRSEHFVLSGREL